MSILVGIPTHSRNIDAGLLTASHAFGACGRVEIKWTGASLLAANFNQLLCEAKNRDHEWLLIWHGDVIPTGAAWLQRMLGVAEMHRADLMSAVVPIKNPSGLTSTAALVPDGVRRLTLREIAALPANVFCAKTCGIPDARALLANTGLLLVRMANVNPEELHFTVRDAVRREGVGRYAFRVWPEDWGFSLKAQELGLRVYATTDPRVSHVGAVEYSTAAEPWGVESDPNRGEVL